MQKITVLSGGMGGARFLQGLIHGIGQGSLPGVAADAEVTVVANTADDLWIHGLKVCPDLDTVMYTLGQGIDLERGWGRRDETWSAKADLEAYGVESTWFGLGDREDVDPGPGLDEQQNPTEGAISNDEAVSGQDAGETA